MTSIASGDGPIQVSPAAVTASAKAARSDKNPYPGCTASAPALKAAATMAWTFRYVSAVVSPASAIAWSAASTCGDLESRAV
jgi:hypothetical protein